MNGILQCAIDRIPPGKWAVGVSGGADSIALLCLLNERKDLSLWVVHLDHETRQGESAVDAEFVRNLAERFKLPCDVSTFNQIVLDHPIKQSNRSGRFREARFVWFGQVVREHHLRGVILAHHLDDQAETVMLRLLRGSGYRGLAGMSPRRTVGGLVILRPMLGVQGDLLRLYLDSIGQDWREDQSNASPMYARNRVRKLLRNSPELTSALIDLGKGCRALREWSLCAPKLDATFLVAHLADQPGILARESARRWLVGRGVPREELSAAVVDRLIAMASDAASSPRVQFPGGFTVRRRKGIISIALLE